MTTPRGPTSLSTAQLGIAAKTAKNICLVLSRFSQSFIHCKTFCSCRLGLKMSSTNVASI